MVLDRWKIWFKHFDENGKLYAAGVYCETYAHKRSEVRAAKREWKTAQTKWIVSKTNPWIAYVASKEESKEADHA